MTKAYFGTVRAPSLPAGRRASPGIGRVGAGQRMRTVEDAESTSSPSVVRAAVRQVDWGSSAIGIDLGGTKIAFGAVDAAGRAHGVHRHPTRAWRGPEKVIGTILDCLHGCWTDGIPPVRAIGVGVAGQLDSRGTVLSAPNLRWRRVPLARWLARATHRPVTAENDVRAATYGEWKFGAGRGTRDMVCVFVGTGVGGGMVADGALRVGAHGTAGEVGHMTIDVGGRKCHCRNRGCLEAYVGGWAIAARAQEAVRAHPRQARGLTRAAGANPITSKTVEEAYYAGDPLARMLVAETVDRLAAGLVSIVNAFDPGLIVLGGGVMEGFPSLLPSLRRLVKAQGLRAAVKDLRIVRAGLGGSSGIVGSAALAMDTVRES